MIVSDEIHSKNRLAAGERLDNAPGGMIPGAEGCHGRQNWFDKNGPKSYFTYRELTHASSFNS